MDASDEVRVVDGMAWERTGATFFMAVPPRGAEESPALLVIGSGLTADELRGALVGNKPMLVLLRSALYWMPGPSHFICQRCHGDRPEGGSGILGDPDCVVRCAECGWQPLVMQEAIEAVSAAIERLAATDTGGNDGQG